MKRFDLIEHTADIGLIAYGNTLAEAFSNAAFGMFSIIAELDNVEERASRTLELAEDDTEALLFEWLNGLLYLFDVDSLLLKRFDIQEFDGLHLKAVCHGEPYDPERHDIKLGVKAATYHQMRIDREKNQVQVIFDV
ncbi:MAG: archease [Chloroflexi bacterium]|nr:archease [Chloroflexota bacterium]